MNLHYSAPIGVILLGEAGLLYGKPALGSALGAQVAGAITSQDQVLKGSCRFYDIAMESVLNSLKTPQPKGPKPQISIELPRDIPEDFEGLEAAEIVVTTAILYEWVTKKLSSQEEINNISFRAHKKANPKASGLYTSLSALGGLIYYRKEFEFLKGIYKLPYKIPENIEKELYISFAKADDVYNINPKKADAILSEQEKHTKRAVVAIIKEDAKLFFDQLEPMNKQNYKFSQSFDGVVKL